MVGATDATGGVTSIMCVLECRCKSDSVCSCRLRSESSKKCRSVSHSGQHICVSQTIAVNPDMCMRPTESMACEKTNRSTVGADLISRGMLNDGALKAGLPSVVSGTV